MEVYIKGQFKKSIFKSENGYIIGLFKVYETNDDELSFYIDRSIPFTGYFHELNEVDTYLFYGSLINHPKYGDQFQVEKYERCMPEDKNSIVEFLSSGLFKGIGEAKAKKIEKVLGKDTFKVILENPSNLILIPTITEKNANELHTKLLEYESSYETVLYLTKMGFNAKEGMLIFHKYKENTIKQIEENIYQLIEDIYEMYFKKIDSIALKSGIESDSVIRIDASILYVLRELSNSYGHCYFYQDEIMFSLNKILGFNPSLEVFQDRIKILNNNLKIKIVDSKIYLRDLYDAEVSIVERVQYLMHQKDEVIKELDKKIEQLEEYFDIKYNNDQKNAIKNSYLKKFLIITGGPGTGKTTIMKGIMELFRQINGYDLKKLNEKVALLAPTGRAAKRMSEATNLSASTIHRFLKWNKENDSFQVNEYNKSKVEFVLVDEASMIDTYLFNNLLKGLSVNTKIILVGDYDQLPSVGPGQILFDFITSQKLNVCYLNELYRQEQDSNIVSLAYQIKNDSLNSKIFNEKEDLTFIKCQDSEVLNQISLIANTYKDISYKDFQILAPMYKTLNGIDQINTSLQQIYNEKEKSKKEILVGDVTYREGDKVIQLTNMPDDNVYNGDIGIISKIITKPHKEIYIDFDDNIVKYTSSAFHKFKLAYAISIHKSQGSEFDIVIIPMVVGFKKMLYQKLIYTAVTRCKNKLFLVGDINALELAIKNKSSLSRRTSIKDFLTDGIKHEF